VLAAGPGRAVKRVILSRLEYPIMAETTHSIPAGLTTPEGFLADRERFWHSVTKFMTYVAVALVLLLLILWWWLV